MLSYDAKTLKILQTYATSFHPLLSEVDNNYLQEQGIATGEQLVSHDEVCKMALSAFQASSKSQILDSYLFGLTHQQPIYCSAWSAYSMMLNFKLHKFESLNNTTCYICSAFEDPISKDLIRAKAIQMIGCTPRTMFQIYFNLHFQPMVFDNPSVTLGEKFLIEVFDIIKNLKPDITPRMLAKILKVNVSFKIKNNDIRFLIDTLGVCGILQAKDKPSYLQEFFPRIIEEKKSHSSDWSYPVDFWLSQDGLNIEAIKFWFEGYKNIKAWLDTI